MLAEQEGTASIVRACAKDFYQAFGISFATSPDDDDIEVQDTLLKHYRLHHRQAGRHLQNHERVHWFG
ncbi:hypothetical protein UPYG_G00321420 [Umbra pygmaea]|uniref:Uncharacterized protein n=1 Tax=Umbra pygmaea TaxID=75934 RepID=A0ABD0WNT2_UMBPY